jgi:hypothetical protein
MTVKTLFETTFQVGSNANNPSLSTFRNALAEPEFSHVKRKEHNHTRCDRSRSFCLLICISDMIACRCSALQAQMKAGFATNAAKLEYLERKKAHEAMVEDFRRVEKFWLGLARHSPDQVHMFQFDDTSAFGLPHFGNREPKSVAGKSRIQIVPGLVEDVGRGKKTYVYSFKGAPSRAQIDGLLLSGQCSSL